MKFTKSSWNAEKKKAGRNVPKTGMGSVLATWEKAFAAVQKKPSYATHEEAKAALAKVLATSETAIAKLEEKKNGDKFESLASTLRGLSNGNTIKKLHTELAQILDKLEVEDALQNAATQEEGRYQTAYLSYEKIAKQEASLKRFEEQRAILAVLTKLADAIISSNQHIKPKYVKQKKVLAGMAANVAKEKEAYYQEIKDRLTMHKTAVKELSSTCKTLEESLELIRSMKQTLEAGGADEKTEGRIRRLAANCSAAYKKANDRYHPDSAERNISGKTNIHHTDHLKFVTPASKKSFLVNKDLIKAMKAIATEVKGL